MSAERIVTYPHMGEYHIAFRALASVMGAQPLTPPRTTNRTLELGARYSPEFVCVPFKYNLGNQIEALEAGARVIVQAGGGCRFGYYGEVQEQILRDLGHEFEFVSLADTWSVFDLLISLKRINPEATYARVLHAFAIAWAKARAIEAAEDFWRKNVGFEVERGEMDRTMRTHLADLDAAMTLRAIHNVRRDWLAALAAVELDKPAEPMRVGVVGEVFAVMDPTANHDIERKLALQGFEVHRFITLTTLIEHGVRGRSHVNRMLELGRPYVTFHLGADGTDSVAKTWKLLQDGFDGVAHLKPFGCMPEVSAMSALARISREHTFPVLCVSYDAQTSEAGIVTRVEAFCDMLKMRKRGVASA